jgi:hypothetical protein
MLVILGTVLGVLSVGVTVWIFAYERRRSPESVPGKPVRAGKKQRTIAIWTIGRFYQALRQFDQYCDRLESSEIAENNDPARPSREDLLRFAEAVLLTAAIDILPFSQGKANLFHFIDEPHKHTREIVSQTFTGAFPPSQVLGAVSTYREMKINNGEKADSVVGECVRMRRCQLERITKKSNFSGEEIELGTTHILGMPVKFGPDVGADNFCTVRRRMPAAITVDMRVVLARPLLRLIRRFWLRRAESICNRLSRYGSLQSVSEAAVPAEEAT